MAGEQVLLVEDDRDVREVLLDALEDEGYAVIPAIDGLDALAKLGASPEPPRLILLDVMMPRMDGVKFNEAVAQEPRWAAIPIVILTADVSAREKAEAMGAVDFVLKPVALNDVLGSVARAIEGVAQPRVGYPGADPGRKCPPGAG